MKYGKHVDLEAVGISVGPIITTGAKLSDESDSNHVGAEAAVHMMQ